VTKERGRDVIDIPPAIVLLPACQRHLGREL
jgi:hypothetical protein